MSHDSTCSNRLIVRRGLPQAGSNLFADRRMGPFAFEKAFAHAPVSNDSSMTFL